MLNSNESYNEAEKIVIWSKAKICLGANAAQWRKDRYGAWICYSQYGNTASPYGWEIDHIFPSSMGGSDDYSNLQPLQWENNRAKADNFPFFNAPVTANGNINVYK